MWSALSSNVPKKDGKRENNWFPQWLGSLRQVTHTVWFSSNGGKGNEVCASATVLQISSTTCHMVPQDSLPLTVIFMKKNNCHIDKSLILCLPLGEYTLSTSYSIYLGFWKIRFLPLIITVMLITLSCRRDTLYVTEIDGLLHLQIIS